MRLKEIAIATAFGAMLIAQGEPITYGYIGGDLPGGLLSITVSVVYFYFTGERPTVYSIFPG